MFAAFDVNFDNDFKALWKTKRSKYQNAYLEKTFDMREQIQSKITNAIKGNKIDGNTVQNTWFPKVKNMDVFLSHSHEDIADVRAFAGWLQEMLGLNVFIDTDLWGDIKKLEKKLRPLLNKELSISDNKRIYDYDNSRKMFQHTNTMLSVALQQMIDESEALFFLNTDKSIKVHEENLMNATYSPWIYSEVACSRIIRRKPLICYRDETKYYKNQKTKSKLCESLNEEYILFSVVYQLDLEHMIKLNKSDFSSIIFEDSPRKIGKPCNLDTLYKKKYKKGWNEFENHLLLKINQINSLRNVYK